MVSQRALYLGVTRQASAVMEEGSLQLHCTGGVPKRYKQGERGAVNSFMELTLSLVPLFNAASMDTKSELEADPGTSR